VEMVREDLKPSRILTREAFENAITVDMAVGGSTNAVVHLLAIAGRTSHKLLLDDFDTISRRIEEEFASDFPEPAVFTSERMKVLRAAVVMANEIPNSLILVFTRHGTNAAGLAAHRPAHSPILAITDAVATMRQLRMVRGGSGVGEAR